MESKLKVINNILDAIVYVVLFIFFVESLIFTANITIKMLSTLFLCILILLVIRNICGNISSRQCIKFARTRDDAIIPTREKGNAGFDIYGVIPKETPESSTIIIEPHTTVLIPTGIRSIIPDDYYIQIHERGSTGSKGIKYSAGVIDSSYRGEWFLATTNTNDKAVIFYEGNEHWLDIYKDSHPKYKDAIFYSLSKAIFQGVVHSTHNDLNVRVVPEITIDKSKTGRGNGKLGSSGK